MKHLILFFITTLVFSSDVSPDVVAIKITGNRVTQEEVILREIHHPIPAEFDSTQAVEDRNGIYNLGIFSTVDVSQQDSTYVVHVVEAIRILALPTVGYNESKGTKGWTYGALLIYSNFRGLNENLEFGGTFGDINSYFLEFNDPWVWGDHGSLTGGIMNQYQDDDAHPIGIRLRKVNIGSGFEINDLHKFRFMASYNKRSLRVTDENTILDNLVIPPDYQHVELEMEYFYDGRDIYWDPSSGILAGINWVTDKGLSGSPDLNRIELSFNYYHKLFWNKFDPVLSYKSKAVFQSPDELPVYRLQYLGGKSYVRGYSSVPVENTPNVEGKIQVHDLIYQTLEVQQTLFEKKDYSGIEAGIDIVFFLDYGFGASTYKSFKPSYGLIGYGCGLRFFASSLGVLAIDFGFNPYEPGTRMHLRD